VEKLLNMFPRKAYALGVTEAGWWYEGTSSIDVFAKHPSGATTSVRITKRQLLSWLAKLDEPEK